MIKNQIIFIFFLISLIVTLDTHPKFEEFIKIYEKNYSPQQKIRRAAIYQKKIDFLNTHPKEDAEYSINQFSDWTDQQLNGKTYVYLGFANTKFDENATSNQFKSKVNSDGSPVVGAAPSVDWRDQGIISSVKNQRTCGDCWAFTAVAMAQTALLNKTGKQYDLSEQFVLECTSSGSCKGGYINQGIKTIINMKGVPLQTDYPYQIKKPVYGTSICDSSKIIEVPIKNQTYYYNLSSENLQELLTIHPVAVAMKVETKFYSYKNGIYHCNGTIFSQLNHAVQLIGYDNYGNWIIKNQWGTTWGMQGYATIDAIDSCGIGLAVYELSELTLNIKLIGIIIIMFYLLI